jgi:hypothetical protein
MAGAAGFIQAMSYFVVAREAAAGWMDAVGGSCDGTPCTAFFEAL